ncbi:hypothetical protein SCLCIDRAFT_614487 [Scleroderma citrinum Foug A]|uniref:Uncharacterized protein n=1 Tax=Scleroderma citrinum Foug A TaxID=1036808 RepID=A0A0C2ZT43_9AGAM|nr:hypothetical protein SCLCIDRAFT_614487 [Scleroderma citrinum Foug A]
MRAMERSIDREQPIFRLIRSLILAPFVIVPSKARASTSPSYVITLIGSYLHHPGHQQTGTVTGRAGRASQSCTELYSSPQQFHFTDDIRNNND